MVSELTVDCAELKLVLAQMNAMQPRLLEKFGDLELFGIRTILFKMAVLAAW